MRLIPLSNEGKSEEELNQVKRIKVLKLSDKRVEELKEMKCKTYSGPEPEEDSAKSVEIINLSNLVGSARPMHPGPNWYEALKDCHKMYHFNEFSQESYESLLLDPQNDIPHVIKYKDEYYIATGGKHRLTIGKCMGTAQAKVIVTEMSE